MELCDEYLIHSNTGQVYAVGQNERFDAEQWIASVLSRLPDQEGRKLFLQMSDTANICACVAGKACVNSFAARNGAQTAWDFRLTPFITGSDQAVLSITETTETESGFDVCNAVRLKTAASEQAEPSPTEEEAGSDIPPAERDVARKTDMDGKDSTAIMDHNKDACPIVQMQLSQAPVADLEYEMDLLDIRKKSKNAKIATALFTFVLTLILFVVLYARVPWFREYLGYYLPQAPTEQTETDATVSAQEHTEHDPVYIPFQQSMVFSAQLLHTGTPRLNDSTATYNTLEFTLTVTSTLGPSDFEANYGKDYELSGTEACVIFTLKYLDVSTSADVLDSIVPQNALEISVTGANGENVEEYQLSNAAVAGTYNVSLNKNKTKTFYKRYKASDDIRYLQIRYYTNGEVYYQRFALYQGDGRVTYASLQKGDKGKLVTALQEKLVELGYLKRANGSFESNTQAAVKLAQEANNLTQNGIADDTLLHLLLDVT